MRRSTGYLIAVAVIVGAVGVAALLVSLAPEPETREPPSQIPYADSAGIVAGAGPIPVHGAGTVRPSAAVDLAPQVGGRVVWVDAGFVSGRAVDSGQTLFRLEEADYEYRVREAEAALAASQVALLEAREDAAVAQAEYERYAEPSPRQRAAGAKPVDPARTPIEGGRGGGGTGAGRPWPRPSWHCRARGSRRRSTASYMTKR